MSGPVVLHVGFSKTATTSLQNFVFPKLPGIDNLGKPFVEGGTRKALYEALLHLTFSEELHYDRVRVESDFARVLAQHSAPVLISSEGLTHARHNDPALVAARLHALMPQASIVFTIREQRAWLRSLYLDDCSRFVFSAPMPRFTTWLGWEKAKRNRSALLMIDFAATVRRYEALFGRERVHVLAYEQMLADPRAFCARLGPVLGVPPEELAAHVGALPRSNAALSAVAYRFGLINYYLVPALARRILDRLPAPVKRVIVSGRPPRFVLPAITTDLIAARVREGNRYLADTQDLDLRTYGYLL